MKIKRLFLLLSLLALVLVCCARFLSLWDSEAFSSFRNSPRGLIPFQLNKGETFLEFKKRVVIYKPTKEIEDNVEKIFYAHKDNISPELGTFSIDLFEKIGRIDYQQKILEACDSIIGDKYGFQSVHEEAVAIAVQILLDVGENKKAFEYLASGFTEPRTPSVLFVGYYFNDLLFTANEFLNSCKDVMQVRKILESLLIARQMAQFNFKLDLYSYFTANIYLFDFLIYRCQSFLKMRQEAEVTKENLIKTIQRSLKANFIFELFFPSRSLPVDRSWLAKEILAFLKESGNGPFSPKAFPRGFIQKTNKLWGLMQFIASGDIPVIFSPIR